MVCCQRSHVPFPGSQSGSQQVVTPEKVPPAVRRSRVFSAFRLSWEQALCLFPTTGGRHVSDLLFLGRQAPPEAGQESPDSRVFQEQPV